MLQEADVSAVAKKVTKLRDTLRQTQQNVEALLGQAPTANQAQVWN